MIDRKFFFDTVRKSLFGGEMTVGQVTGLNALLTVWEEDFVEHPKAFLAYCLATAYHETGRKMQPVEEIGKGRKKSYGKPVGPYSQAYYGRGHVQLTWEDNYKKANTQLKKYMINVNLHKEPSRALEDEVSAYVLFDGSVGGWFTGKKLANYFGGGKEDPVNARRIINMLDKAETIAGYYRKFKAALRKEVPNAPSSV
jgi:putative chitinase